MGVNMIRFMYGNELDAAPELRRSMHMDRSFQFSQRLKWDVSVNDEGEERDQYDQLNPLYIVVEDSNGSHAGSMRLLPTVGPTMVNDHFLHLTDGVAIQSPMIWECTRLCLGPSSTRGTASALLAAGAKVMLEFNVLHYVGVFDTRMIRIYARLGASPTIVGCSGNQSDQIAVGLWEFDDQKFHRLCLNGGVSPKQIQADFEASELEGNQGTPQPTDFQRAYAQSRLSAEELRA